MAIYPLTKLVRDKYLFIKDWYGAIRKFLPRGPKWRLLYKNDESNLWIDTVDVIDTIDTVGTIDTVDTINYGGVGTFSDLQNLLLVLAGELERFDTRKRTLENESIPGLSSEMLEDWERVAGIPDFCNAAVYATQTVSERQAAVHQKITQGKGDPDQTRVTQSEQYYIDYAANLGYTITISYLAAPFRVGDQVGDRLGGTFANYTWVVSGDYDDYLQCLFERDKPAYTKIYWD